MAILAYIFIILLPIVLLAFGLRWWIRREAYKEKQDRDKPHNKAAAYIYNYSSQLRAIGFVTAIVFCIAIWNYRYEFKVVIEAEKEEGLIMDLFDMSLNTEQPKPKKPTPIFTPKIIEAPKEEVKEDKKLELDSIPPIDDFEQDEEGEEDGEEVVTFQDNTIFLGVQLQKQASLPGGLSLYLIRNYKVPLHDKKAGTKGVIYVSFVIERDGSIANVKVVRGLTKSADAEALKVMKKSPKWDPGMNNGIPVRSTYTIPIKLN